MEYRKGSKLTFDRIKDKKAFDVIGRILASIMDRILVNKRTILTQKRAYKILNTCKFILFYLTQLFFIWSQPLHGQEAALVSVFDIWEQVSLSIQLWVLRFDPCWCGTRTPPQVPQRIRNWFRRKSNYGGTWERFEDGLKEKADYSAHAGRQRYHRHRLGLEGNLSCARRRSQ